MVDFVDVNNLTKWLASTGVEHAIEGLTAYMEEDFRRWESFERTPRVASHSPHGVIELMPTSDNATYSFKYVNGHPINTKANLQTVTAFGVMAEVATGYPTFLAEMTILTAIRTAATSAMVAKLIAPSKVSTMAMIGAGSQAEFQALGFRSALGVETLRLWDTDPDALTKAAKNLRPLGFDVVLARNTADALNGATLITTCTADKSNATILTEEMVGSGVHVNAIGGDCPGKTEIDAALVESCRVFVEHTPQTRIEGEIQQLDDTFAVTEIWEVITGKKPGRTSPEQRTLFDSVGFAIEDFSALRFLRDNVSGTNYVKQLDLIAEPEDPKDLFAVIPTVRSSP